MNQVPAVAQRSVRPPFWTQTGEGIMTTKCTPHNVLRTGQITLPVIGKCFIEGNQSYPQYRGDDLSPIVLEVKSADTRKLVAKITMSGMRGQPRREAKIDQVVEGSSKPVESWKAMVTAQKGPNGPYLRFYIPGVAAGRNLRAVG